MLLFNGKIVNNDDISISYEDRGYYFGDGVYEVFRIYNGKMYEKEAHFHRLERSAESIQLDLPYSTEEMNTMLNNLIQTEQIIEGTLYLQITRGPAPRAHTFPEHPKPTMLAYCKQISRPLTAIQNGISAITLPDIRWLCCDIKSLNLLPNTLAKQKAVNQGAEEAILHRDGTVTECSASNIMIIHDHVLYTHPANNLILHGITREVTLRLADQMGLETKEETFSVGRLYEADEAFITGTTVEITPIIRIDQKPVGSGLPGKLTKQLQQAFEETILK